MSIKFFVKADWWSDMSADQQQQYLDEHPNSDKAKQARQEQKQAKPAEAPAEDKPKAEQPPAKETVKKPTEPEKPATDEAPAPEEMKGPATDEESLSGDAEADRQVVALLDKLKEMADDAKAKGVKAPDYDLCEVSIPGTNLFCGDNKGIPRAKMPQLKGKPAPGSEADTLPKDKNGEVDTEAAFKKALIKKGAKLEAKEVPAATLKATQSQLVGPKIAGMLAALKEDPNNKGITAPIFVSKDGYVLDGHHRWAAVVGLQLAKGNSDPVTMKTIQVDMSIGDLVKFTNEFCEDIGIKPKDAKTEARNRLRAYSIYLNGIHF